MIKQVRKYKHDKAGFANINMITAGFANINMIKQASQFIVFMFVKPALSCLYLRSLLYHVYICEA